VLGLDIVAIYRCYIYSEICSKMKVGFTMMEMGLSMKDEGTYMRGKGDVGDGLELISSASGKIGTTLRQLQARYGRSQLR
jgi:hypothetical protein